MKILLSWLLDHLDASFDDINVEKLIHLFNTRTAEIESYTKITFDHSRYFMMKVITSENEVEAFCDELNCKITLPKRSDAQKDKHFMAIRHEQNWRWATLQDFGSEKDGLMPAMLIDQPAHAWKKSIPAQDYILEIDNKSINHRPDLWGHYGIAREVAAFLDLQLKPLDVAKLNLASSSQNLSIKLKAEKDCSRIAAVACNGITSHDSVPRIAIRLAQVESKPMSFFIDLTNYVMLDIGHPMHVFDAASFPNHELIVRLGENNEQLELLDGQKIAPTTSDVVIANQQQAVSLAGIMGAKGSGWNANTKNIILEAAGFDPLTIRKTAQRFKLRTESSMRFEKHLDPMQNVTAIQRFVFLAQKLNLFPKISEPIVVAGQDISSASCTLSHEFVEKKLGAKISSEFITNTLTKLGFGVTYDAKSNSYTIIIPTFRMTKDIKIQEDLVEEIIRSYGFENLQAQLPTKQTSTTDIHIESNISHIKRHLAFSLHMHEVRDYLLYDSAFISKLDIDLSTSISVKNPMSQNWITLVTSLIPHLLKSVETNVVGNDHLRFFELNRTWRKENNDFLEQQTLSGIIFDKKTVNFYSAKAELQSLFEMLKIEVTWQKPTKQIPAWFNAHQVAEINFNGKSMGLAGMISPTWMHKISQGSAFIFELDNAQVLAEHKAPNIKFKPWSKFQEVCYDISLFVPVAITFDTLQKSIKDCDALISNVTLLDFFEKEEMPDVRAITLRYTINNHEKTMTKQELTDIIHNVEQAMVANGAKIR